MISNVMSTNLSNDPFLDHILEECLTVLFRLHGRKDLADIRRLLRRFEPAVLLMLLVACGSSDRNISIEGRYKFIYVSNAGDFELAILHYLMTQDKAYYLWALDFREAMRDMRMSKITETYDGNPVDVLFVASFGPTGAELAMPETP